ncbi:MAG: YolD-like family protein [Bacilli bacterium]|jgi:hypothetical protein|nr:YolD-like family protein [Bacilli bacterium]
MKDRGMAKWMPYKSLAEQKGFMDTVHAKKRAVEKPLISAERAQEINETLSSYAGEDVAISFFLAGSIKKIRGKIQRIDNIYKLIKINDISILFSSIVNIDTY